VKTHSASLKDRRNSSIRPFYLNISHHQRTRRSGKLFGSNFFQVSRLGHQDKVLAPEQSVHGNAKLRMQQIIQWNDIGLISS